MLTSIEERQAVQASAHANGAGTARALYEGLMVHGPTPLQRERMAGYLSAQMASARALPLEPLPRDLEGLLAWSRANQARVSEAYRHYLARRRAGGAREYFSSRSHALYFLRGAAPTKLVDGAWLYSTVGEGAAGQGDGREHLARTYFEELGNGDASKNHVVLYRKLLAENGLEQWRDLPDDFYVQGAIQLSLGWLGADLLPEVAGFNLGYEQLPLHLLVTAYELDELGIDPYYFTLHVTVDNPDTGHARRACEAVVEAARDAADVEAYWDRVATGYRLNDLGAGTLDVVHHFDAEAEALRVLAHKAVSGHGAHSDYCRIQGKTVNEWLAEPAGIADFVQALEAQGWIRRGAEPGESRFWGLLQGERAKMFGVFSDYELQVLCDWLRADAARDGRPFFVQPGERVLPHRVAERRKAAHAPGCTNPESDAAVAKQALLSELAACAASARAALIEEALSPLRHWTPRGLAATHLRAAQILASV